ncbi:Ionotropic receptor 148 [Blattella germanica]|nr:Ionotropic receptor 148 [Blattella germanica]
MHVGPNSGLKHFRTISIVVFLVFILRPSGNNAYAFLEEMVASVHEYFHSGCILMLQGGQQQPSLSAMTSSVRLQTLLKNVPVFAALPSRIGRLAVNCLPRLLLIVALSSNAEMLAEVLEDQRSTPTAWLVLLERGTTLENVFDKVNVPFNLELLVAQPQGSHLVALTEVYRVESGGPLQTIHFGSWTRLEGVVGPKTSFYGRRSNFQGLTFRVVGIMLSIGENSAGDIVGVSGHFGTLWKILEKELNFTSEFFFPKDNNYGTMVGNGSWNGMIGEVQRGEAHFCCSSILLTTARNGAVDFLSPLVEVRMTFAIREPSEFVVTWREFLDPFTWQLWSAQVACMLLIGACFLAVSSFYGPKEGDASRRVSDAVFHVFSIFTLKGQSDAPASLSARTILWFSHFAATILLAGYSACLISHLTTKKVKMPFSSLREFLESNIELGAIPFSALNDFFKNSSSPDMREVDARFISGHEASAPRSDSEGLRRVCQRSSYAYLTYLEVVSHAARGCDVGVVPGVFFPASLGFIANKRSPYRKIFNMKIHDLRISGVLQRLHQVFFPLRASSTDLPLPVVDFSDVKSIFAVLFAAVLASNAILLCERLGRSRM